MVARGNGSGGFLVGRRLDAVLFDTDGVITDTAKAHCASWKVLFDGYLAERGEGHAPFETADYLAHVDGKPRHDGVRSFLLARGIDLPWGAADDPPDRETICGLGNRKNRHFLAWLSANRVEPFPGTVALVAALRRAGMRVAAFSSSRNAVAVLQSAGVEKIFDLCLAGGEMAALGLPGKPDPAILIETARRLGVEPARAAVVEDAVSGVEAGRRGGFAQIVGIDRHGDGAGLRAAGADLVVSDLAQVELDAERRLVRRAGSGAEPDATDVGDAS